MEWVFESTWTNVQREVNGNGTFSLFMHVHSAVANDEEHHQRAMCKSTRSSFGNFAFFNFADKLRWLLLLWCARHLLTIWTFMPCDLSQCVAQCSLFPFQANYNYTIITQVVFEFWSVEVHSYSFGWLVAHRLTTWKIINNSSAKVQLLHVGLLLRFLLYFVSTSHVFIFSKYKLNHSNGPNTASKQPKIITQKTKIPNMYSVQYPKNTTAIFRRFSLRRLMHEYFH